MLGHVEQVVFGLELIEAVAAGTADPDLAVIKGQAALSSTRPM
jgi:hypothetical protein